MALLAICLGYFLVILDATVVNVALPAIHAGLGGGVTAAGWIVDAYAVAFAALLLTGGAVSDRLGARRVYLTALATFGVASAACAVSPSIAALTIARAAQGTAAAGLVPASLALLDDAYRTEAGRARAIGIWGAVAGVAAASGPLIGGALVAASGWRLVFLINVPLVATAAALTTRSRPAATPRREGRADAAGQALAAIALTALAFALIERRPALLALAAAVAAAFVGLERRRAHPMLPLELFSMPGFAAASAVGLLINLGFYGELFGINLYLQQTRSALSAGLALLPQLAMATIASALAGRLIPRFGARAVMIAGLALGAVGLVALRATAGGGPYTALVPGLVATGFGMALTMPAATMVAVGAPPPRRKGIAAGVLNAARQVGSAVGVAVVGGAIAGHRALVAGLHDGLWVAAAAFATGALAARAFVPARAGRAPVA